MGDEIFYEIKNKELRLRDSRFFPLASYASEKAMAFDIVWGGRRVLPSYEYFNIKGFNS